MRPERIDTVCGDCGGRAVAQRTVLLDQLTGRWLHVHTTDWIDRPHDVRPRPADAKRLQDALDAQERRG